MKIKALTLLVALIFISGCDLFQDDKSYPPVQEGLVSLDGGTHTYMLHLPDGFRDEKNYMNLYPLVIGLHGSTTSTSSYYVKNEVRNAYPCVYFAPNNTNIGFGGSNAAWIREVVHSIIENKNYKIDRNRIYIIGFSMGGMGTTYMAQDLFTDYEYLTAAIVPAEGGMFDYIKSNKVRDHISCWFHIGSASSYYDQEADYKSAKKYYPGTLEIVKTGTFTYSIWNGTVSYDITSYTLKQIKTEIFKSTTYAGMGHTDEPVFKNPEVIEWLFNQNTADRDLY
ncbi:MAG: alpha/beta hydrolase [Spirochaetes bacterium]|nr:alpha/beta hydrolase [Spirochaetota bacterium]